MKRLLLLGTLALGLAVVPVSTVQACSCALLGGPEEVAVQATRDGEVAFLGTVVDAAPARADPNGFGPIVAYAFEVERASVAVPAVLEVRALDDGGGASCGFTFGHGESWFVSAQQVDGALHTGLCNGNMRLTELGADGADRLRELLPVEPSRDAPSEEGAAPAAIDWLPAAVVLLLLAAGAVTIAAFRHDRP